MSRTRIRPDTEVYLYGRKFVAVQIHIRKSVETEKYLEA